MNYIGVDLHKNRFTVAYRSNKEVKVVTYHLREMDKFISTLQKDDYVFIEATANTFAFCDRIKDYVKEVIVIDPFQFRVICDSGKKTDRIDARKLAKMGQYHIESGRDFLPEVYIPEEGIRRLRSLFTTYTLISKELTMTKNRIYSLCVEELEIVDGYTIDELKEEYEGLNLSEGHKMQIRVLFRVIETLEEEKEEVKREILLAGEPYKDDVDILVSISGVSVFIALGLIADYGDVKRFKNGKAFSKYLRSVPRSEVSNEKVWNGKTYKSGRKLSINLILQGMNHFVKDDSPVAKSYNRIKKSKGACKARVASVRKIFVIIYYMLINREYYRYMNKKLHDRKMRDYENFLKRNKIAA
jgi:transposase